MAVCTVFCQGNGASRAQSAKYAGPAGVDVLTGDGRKERVVIYDSPQLLHNLYVYPEFSDVDHGFSWNPLHWLQHLFQWLVAMYFGSEGGSTHHSNMTEMNVGGEQDVAEYLRGVRSCLALHPTKRLVLFGCSRGAATVLVAATSLTEEERRHVAFVVAEGPFDTVPHVVHYRASFSRRLPEWLSRVLGNVVLFVLERFAKYRPRQTSPLEALSRWPKDLPLAMVRSRVDDIVPEECTLPLIKVLHERGHQLTHQLVLHKSPHVNMPNGNKSDRRRYEKFMRDLYARYTPQQ